MSKLYVLMERGWNYNDEIYFSSHGGSPKRIFSSKKKANQEVILLNITEFKKLVTSGDIREYSYDLESILARGVTDEDLLFEEGPFMQVFGMPAEDWWEKLLAAPVAQPKDDITDEQWQKLYDCFNLSFYEVVECERE